MNHRCKFRISKDYGANIHYYFSLWSNSEFILKLYFTLLELLM